MPQRPPVMVHESEVGSVMAADGTLVHMGIDSCLTITCFIGHEICGAHLVFNAAALPSLHHPTIRQLRQRVHGRQIQKIVIAAPFAFWADSIDLHDVATWFGGAPQAIVNIDVERFGRPMDIYFQGPQQNLFICALGRPQGSRRFALLQDGDFLDRDSFA